MDHAGDRGCSDGEQKSRQLYEGECVSIIWYLNLVFGLNLRLIQKVLFKFCTNNISDGI